MKKMGITLLCTGIVAGAGAATYLFMNKNTKQKTEKLINNVLNEANQKVKKIS